MPERHLALFVTLSAYGNRLHGDPRGTVDRHHNEFGEPLMAENPAREHFERLATRFRPVEFGARERAVVEGAVREACDFVGWRLLPVNCRTNHLHAVVATEDDRVKVMARLKTRSTIALREARAIERLSTAWARGGSGRYLWTERDVESACEYVVNGQGAPLPGTEVWRESQ